MGRRVPRGRGMRWTAWLLVLVLFLAACGSDGDGGEEGAAAEGDGTTATEEDDGGGDDGATSSGEPTVGGTFVAAIAEDLDATDPHRTSGETGPVWLSLIFETLLGVDENATVVPGLAESWEVSEDGLTYTFTLREGVTFHNGRELTAEDVKFNYERIADPETGAASTAIFGVVDAIEAPDDRTVVLNLTAPNGALLSDLALQGRLGIVAPESYDDGGDIVEFIGTGPYAYGSYTVNDRLVLERYADYWGEPAYIETIEVRIVPDASARLAALASGEIDFAWNVPPQQATAEAESGSFSLQEFPQNRGNFFAINPDKAPFDDVEVRRAMHLAVSRDDIAAAGWNGFALANDQPFGESSFWYVERDTRTTADIAAATAAIEEAGATGTEVTILQWDALGSDTEAQLVASAWDEIGLSTSIEIVDIGTLVERAGTGDFDVLYLWVGLNLDPNRPYAFWEADSPRNPVVANFSTPELDQLVKDARATIDQDERKELYAQALDVNYEQGGTFYTVSPQQLHGVADRVQGYEQGAFYVNYAGGGIASAWLEEGSS